MADTSIGLSRRTRERLEPVKEASDAETWNEFMDTLVANNLGVEPKDLDEYAVEHHERVEETRATAVGLLEALDETDMVDEAVEIITALSQQDMLAQNTKIIEHLIEKSNNGGEVTEMDQLLAKVVMETESARNHESPAAEIARGLFTDSVSAERTTTQQATSPTPGGSDSTLFSSDEDEPETIEAPISVVQDDDVGNEGESQ